MPSDPGGNEILSYGSVSGYWGILLLEARRSAEQARNAYQEDDSHREAGAAGSAILCAAAACEAMLSEELLENDYVDRDPPAFVTEIRSLQSSTEKWKRLLDLYASDFDAGACPEFDALGCLFQVRHLVAHRRARIMRHGQWPPQISDCIRQGLVSAPELDDRQDWTSVLFTATVAEWAHTTAKDWIRFALPNLPQAQYTYYGPGGDHGGEG